MRILKLSDFNIDDSIELRDRAILTLLKCTGIRSGEVPTIRIEDLDLDKRTVKIFDSKKKTYFILPLSKEVCELLRGYIGSRTTGYLFPSNHTGKDKMTRTNIFFIVRKFNSRLSPRNFRHYFARYWVLKHGDLCSLQAILRHKNIAMTAHHCDQIRFEEESAIVQQEYDRVLNA